MANYICVENAYWNEDPNDRICFTRGKIYTKVEYSFYSLSFKDDRGHLHAVDGGWEHKFIERSDFIPYLWYKLKAIL